MTSLSSVRLCRIAEAVDRPLDLAEDVNEILSLENGVVAGHGFLMLADDGEYWVESELYGIPQIKVRPDELIDFAMQLISEAELELS